MVVNLRQQRHSLLIRARGFGIAALTQQRVADPHERSALPAEIAALAIREQRGLKHLHGGVEFRRAAAHGLAKQRLAEMKQDRACFQALRRQKGLGLPQSIQRIGELRFQAAGDADMQQKVGAKRG